MIEWLDCGKADCSVSQTFFVFKLADFAINVQPAPLTLLPLHFTWSEMENLIQRVVINGSLWSFDLSFVKKLVNMKKWNSSGIESLLEKWKTEKEFFPCDKSRQFAFALI